MSGKAVSTPSHMQAAARLHHAYFTGLMLTLVTRRSADVAAEWVFRVFRHQHHEKFLSSFEKLGLVDGHHLGGGIGEPEDFGGAVDGDRFDGAAVVAGDAVDSRVAGVEVRLEYLNLAPRDHGAADSTNQFFTLAAEHYPGDDLDTSRARYWIHQFLFDRVSG